MYGLCKMLASRSMQNKKPKVGKIQTVIIYIGEFLKMYSQAQSRYVSSEKHMLNFVYLVADNIKVLTDKL